VQAHAALKSCLRLLQRRLGGCCLLLLIGLLLLLLLRPSRHTRSSRLCGFGQHSSKHSSWACLQRRRAGRQHGLQHSRHGRLLLLLLLRSCWACMLHPHRSCRQRGRRQLRCTQAWRRWQGRGGWRRHHPCSRWCRSLAGL
jgi:hypothetical protein